MRCACFDRTSLLVALRIFLPRLWLIGWGLVQLKFAGYRASRTAYCCRKADGMMWNQLACLSLPTWPATAWFQAHVRGCVLTPCVATAGSLSWV